VDEATRLTVSGFAGFGEGQPMDELILLYSRALDLLSRSSAYVPRELKDEIVTLARDGGRAGVPVRVERAGGMVIIDPWKNREKKTPTISLRPGMPPVI
jgi:hypothetical protein